MSQKQQTLLGANKYTITVSFVNSNLVISDFPTTNKNKITQRNVEFTEICNYFNARFPARVLRVTMNFDEIDRLFASRNEVSEEDKMFDVDILVTPVGSSEGVSHLMPIKSGSYKGLMKTNETINSYLTTRNSRATVEQNASMTTDVEFILFKEPELRFSLNPNINFLYTGNNLMSMFVHMCCKAVGGMKMIISKLDHNPVVPKFLIPRMSLSDGIELFADEFGFYKSGHSLFVEDNIMYFLNKEENPRVTNNDLDYEILLDVNRYTGRDNSQAYKQNIDSERSMITKINVDRIKVFVNNNNVLKNDPIYISPSGKTSFTKNSSARNVDVIRKITEIPHIATYSNVQYEYIDLTLDDVSFINVNNLTKIVYIDSANNVRVYRVNFKYTRVVSNTITETRLQAFRILKKS